jgi:GST-like protein
MIDLYALTSPNVQKIIIMLEEIELAYRIVPVDVWKAEQYNPKKYDVIQWLMIQLTGIGPAFGNFTHFNLFAPKPGNDYSLSRYRTEMKRLYELLENRLGKLQFLGGDEYSIADIATFPWTRQHDAHGVKWEDKPNLKRWFEAISERPAVQRAIEKVNAIKSSRDVATDEHKDRFFGRGRYARA